MSSARPASLPDPLPTDSRTWWWQVKAQGSPYNWDFYASGVAGFTYRFWDADFVFEGARVGPPVVPFGFGLSYTTWEYANMTLTPASSASEPLPGCSPITVTATVRNTGLVGSDEVSQSCEWHQQHATPAL